MRIIKENKALKVLGTFILTAGIMFMGLKMFEYQVKQVDGAKDTNTAYIRSELSN